MRTGIIVLSTRSFCGEREDKTTPILMDSLLSMGFEVVSVNLIDDSLDKLVSLLTYLSDQEELDLIITSGGTGVSPNDITPEGTSQVLEREISGISEAIRAYSLKYTPQAMLSRGLAGIRKNTLIINLPGNPKAVKEILEFLEPALFHAIPLIHGEVVE